MAGSERKIFQWESKIAGFKKEFRVEGEMALSPDSPPIERIVMHELRLADVETEVGPDGLNLQGRLIPQIVYSALADESGDNPGAVWIKEEFPEGIKFQQRVEMPPMSGSCRWSVDCRVERGAVERLLHHTVRVEAEIVATIAVWAAEQREFLTEAKALSAGDLRVIKEPVRMNAYIGTFTGTVQAQGLLDLPYSRPPVARALWVRANPSALRWEAQNNRIKLEGDLEVCLTYVSSEDDGREGPLEMVEWRREKPPFRWQAELDAPGVDDGSVLYPQISVKFVRADQRGGESLAIEAVLQAAVEAYRPVQGEVVTDLDSRDFILDLDKRKADIVQTADQRTISVAIDRLAELPAGRPEIGRIVGFQAFARNINGECLAGKFLLEGEIDLRIAYVPADEDRFPGVYTAAWESASDSGIVWSETIDAPEIDEGMQAEVKGAFLGTSVELVDGRKVRLLSEALLNLRALEEKAIVAVADWAEVPAAPSASRPSMIFYLTQPGDTLWKVARRYQTTTAALARENHLAPEEPLPVGKRLIIPTAASGKTAALK